MHIPPTPWSVDFIDWNVVDASGAEVAHVASHLDDVEAADALQLFAAAPNLLSAAEQALAMIDAWAAAGFMAIRDDETGAELPEITSIRAAIARARSDQKSGM